MEAGIRAGSPDTKVSSDFLMSEEFEICSIDNGIDQRYITLNLAAKCPRRGHLVRLHALVVFFIAAPQGLCLALIFFGNQGRSLRASLFGLFQLHRWP